MTPDPLALIDAHDSLVMASLTPQGAPHASTAPFIHEGGCFFIFISTVAQHGRNLLSSSTVSLLFADDEAMTSQPFARRRVTLEATAAPLTRDDPRFSTLLERFAERFDRALMATLQGMDDFHLFILTPTGGTMVLGFGMAYRLDASLTPVGPQTVGHRTSHGR